MTKDLNISSKVTVKRNATLFCMPCTPSIPLIRTISLILMQVFLDIEGHIIDNSYSHQEQDRTPMGNMQLFLERFSPLRTSQVCVVLMYLPDRYLYRFLPLLWGQYMYLWIYAVFVHLCCFQKANVCVCAYLLCLPHQYLYKCISALVCRPICAFVLHLEDKFMYFKG